MRALLIIAAASIAAGAASPQGFRDDFERPLRIDAGGPWAIAQQVDGRVQIVRAPHRAGHALLATAGPKREGRVAKADLVARVPAMRTGARLSIAFDLYVPKDSPRDSVQLVDVECAGCGEAGNPGIRLYLRRGRLRVDRSKIGIRRAWVRDDAPALAADRWHRISWQLRLDPGERGMSRVLLDDREVLASHGATLGSSPRIGADRVQIGITANSNAVPARAWFDDVVVSIRR